jgi:hypothetical protein
MKIVNKILRISLDKIKLILINILNQNIIPKKVSVIF